MEQRKFDFDGASVLEKFKAITIKEDRLTPEDQVVVERYQREHDEVSRNLNWYREFFKAKLKEDEDSAHEYEKDKKWFSTKYDAPWYERFKFSPKGGLHRIDKLFEKAKEEFVEKILGYFNSKYNLELTRSKLLEREIIHSKDIVDYIFSKSNGLELEEKGEENLKKNFRETIYWKERIKLQGCKIKFVDYFRLENMFRGGLEISYHNREKVDLFRRVISFFEFETFNVQSLLARQLEDYKEVNVEEEYRDEGEGQKIRGLRLYKNGNVDLRFASPEIAREFWNTFELDFIKER